MTQYQYEEAVLRVPEPSSLKRDSFFEVGLYIKPAVLRREIAKAAFFLQTLATGLPLRDDA